MNLAGKGLYKNRNTGSMPNLENFNKPQFMNQRPPIK